MANSNPARTFVKNIKGEEITQVAHTPSDAVRFIYDGWREVTEEVTRAAAAAKKAAPSAKADASKTSK